MIRFIAPATLLVCLFAPVLVFAQGNGEWEQLRASGVIKAMARGGFAMQTESGEMWNVALPRMPKDISYQATADLDFLQPGMMVQFSATISNKGQVVGEIPAITVFTPLEKTDLGIIPEGAPGPNPADALFSDVKEEKKPAKPPEQLACYVGGQLVALKGKKMVVSAGGTQLKCDLAENVQVKISVSNLSYVQPGDKVDVQARYYASRKDLGAQAGQVTITAANPLVDLKKKMKTSEQ